MSKKAQVLMLGMWILVILTLLTVAIGHRVSMALRLNRFQTDKLKALYLAKAGVNKAIIEIEKDDNGFDATDDPWADNESAFREIRLERNSQEYASVSFTNVEGEYKNTVFGVLDEERKININTASKELLSVFLSKKGIEDYSDIAENICAWRGRTYLDEPDYTILGYSNKGERFASIQELILVKDINQEIYNKLKDSITVYGEGKVNINTASEEILEILVAYCRSIIRGPDNDPGDLVEGILRLRAGNSFGSFSELEIKLKEQSGLSSGQMNILNKLENVADFKSSCFYIVSNGKINKSNTVSTIGCIFDRRENKVVYWHES